jgi:hypothetical protein
LERQAQDDPFLAEALEGYESTDPTLIVPDLKHLRKHLQAKAQVRGNFSIRVGLISIAALILILFTIGGSWFFDNESPAKKEEIVFQPPVIDAPIPPPILAEQIPEVKPKAQAKKSISKNEESILLEDSNDEILPSSTSSPAARMAMALLKEEHELPPKDSLNKSILPRILSNPDSAYPINGWDAFWTYWSAQKPIVHPDFKGPDTIWVGLSFLIQADHSISILKFAPVDPIIQIHAINRLRAASNWNAAFIQGTTIMDVQIPICLEEP